MEDSCGSLSEMSERCVDCLVAVHPQKEEKFNLVAIKV